MLGGFLGGLGASLGGSLFGAFKNKPQQQQQDQPQNFTPLGGNPSQQSDVMSTNFGSNSFFGKFFGGVGAGMASNLTDKMFKEDEKSPAQRGQEMRDYMENAYPEVTAWEQLGSQASAGAQASNTQSDQAEKQRKHELKITNKQLANTMSIASLQANTEIEKAQIQTDPASQKVNAEIENLINNTNLTSKQIALIIEQTREKETQANIAEQTEDEQIIQKGVLSTEQAKQKYRAGELDIQHKRQTMEQEKGARGWFGETVQDFDDVVTGKTPTSPITKFVLSAIAGGKSVGVIMKNFNYLSPANQKIIQQRIQKLHDKKKSNSQVTSSPQPPKQLQKTTQPKKVEVLTQNKEAQKEYERIRREFPNLTEKQVEILKRMTKGM